jgi:hypothetical protein
MTQMTQINHSKSILHPCTLSHAQLRALHVIFYNLGPYTIHDLFLSLIFIENERVKVGQLGQLDPKA